MAELSYPIDNREAYQSRIRFVVKKAVPLTETFQNIMSAPPPPAPNPTQSAGQAALADQKRTEFDQAQQRQVEKALQVGPEYQTDPNAGVVKLFSPISMTFNDQLDYGTPIDLGVLGGDITAGLAGGQSLTKSVLNSLGDAGTSFMDVLRSGIDMGKDPGRVAAARFTPGVVGSAVKLSVQATTNPNTRLLFNRPGIRQFSFTFKMIPNSREESEAIEAIIKHFRRQAYPKLIAGNTGYEFPDAFGITIHHKNPAIGDTITETDANGNETTRFTSQGNVKIQKIPDCFLIGIDTVYNSTAGVFHKDGYPSEADLTLRFMEMKALSKQDVEAGF